MTCRPCPTCGAPYGFHDDEPHAQARVNISPELLLPTSTSVRKAEQATKRERYQRWRDAEDARYRDTFDEGNDQ